MRVMGIARISSPGQVMQFKQKKPDLSHEISENPMKIQKIQKIF